MPVIQVHLHQDAGSSPFVLRGQGHHVVANPSEQMAGKKAAGPKF